MKVVPRRKLDGRQSVEAAEVLAVEALSFLADEPERLRRFLDICGLGPGNLRAAARDSRFLQSVIEYLASDESLLLKFAEFKGLDPSVVAGAARKLAGEPISDVP